MDAFYITVVIVALIVLIILLIMMGLMLRYQNNQAIYPGTQNSCPDYWQGTNGICTVPKTTDGLNSNGSITNPSGTGTLNAGNTIDTNATVWQSQGLSSICGKKKWAQKNNLTWDGITNYNAC